MSKHEYSMRITWSSDRSISICECAFAFFFLIYYIIFMILVPFNLFAFKLFGHCEPTIQCADMILFFIQIAHFFDVRRDRICSIINLMSIIKIWYISRDIGTLNCHKRHPINSNFMGRNSSWIGFFCCFVFVVWYSMQDIVCCSLKWPHCVRFYFARKLN